MKRFYIALSMLKEMALTDDLAFFDAESLEDAKEQVIAALVADETSEAKEA